MSRTQAWLWLAVAVALQCSPYVARAQEGGRLGWNAEPLMPVRVALHGALDWETRLGFGVRAELPVLAEGFVRDARDEVAISGGLDFILWAPDSLTQPRSVWANVHLQWNLGIDERLVFYPELGLAANWDRGWRGFFPSFGLGARYHVWRSIAVTGRLGWPIGLAVGMTF